LSLLWIDLTYSKAVLGWNKDFIKGIIYPKTQYHIPANISNDASTIAITLIKLLDGPSSLIVDLVAVVIAA